MRKNNTKLNNQAVVIDGIKFQSQKEGNRYCELKLLQRAGEISDLELQKRYELIPAQYEIVETGEFYKIGAKKGCVDFAQPFFALYSVPLYFMLFPGGRSGRLRSRHTARSAPRTARGTGSALHCAQNPHRFRSVAYAAASYRCGGD